MKMNDLIPKKKTLAILAAALFLISTLLIATPVNATITWKGIPWGTAGYGSIAVNVDGDLEVTTSSCGTTNCWGTAHYNTPSAFRAAATPWVRITFIDSGPGSPGAQVWMEDEEYVFPGAGAWTQFGAWDRPGFENYRIYWWDYDTDLSDNGLLDDSSGWGWVDTGVPRTAGTHTIMLAMRADHTVDYWLDGFLVHSTTDITPNYFGDIYLAGHSDVSHPSQTVVFTDYQTGTDYSPSGVQFVKKDVLSHLIALRATITDKNDGHKLDEAIKHLTKSLDLELWVDGTHLQAKHGEKVFNEEKDAVVKLLELLKDKKSTVDKLTLQDFINRLVDADKTLATVAYNDAVAAGGDAKKIAKANEELSKGDARALDGKFVDAIEHYRNAWKHAIEAV
jgi:hypothetical protein